MQRRYPLCTLTALVAATQVLLGQAPQKAYDPVPFRFQISTVSMKSNQKVILDDRFSTATSFLPVRSARPTGQATGYRVILGQLSNAVNVRESTLNIDQASTAPVWGVHAALIELPLSSNANETLEPRGSFPLEMTVRLKSPSIRGPERIYLGLMDRKTMYNVGSVSLSVQGLPKAQKAVSRRRLGPQLPWADLDGVLQQVRFYRDVQNPGDPVDKVLGDLNIGPTVSLVRAEEPQVSGDIVLDAQEMPALAAADAVEMTLNVSAAGELAASGVVQKGSSTQQFALRPKEQSPASFFAPRSKLNVAAANLIPVLYFQTLPTVDVFSVDASKPSGKFANTAGATTLVLHGVGFGLDSKLEVVPKGAASLPVRNLRIGRDCLTLSGEVMLPRDRTTYSIRVTSAGHVVTILRSLSANGEL